MHDQTAPQLFEDMRWNFPILMIFMRQKIAYQHCGGGILGLIRIGKGLLHLGYGRHRINPQRLLEPACKSPQLYDACRPTYVRMLAASVCV